MLVRTCVSLFVCLSFVVAGAAHVLSAEARVEGVSPAARLVHQAQAAEIAGDVKLRAALLDEAVSLDPKYAAAHWQRGEVLLDGQWLSIAAAEKKLSTSPDLVEYRQRRDQLTMTPADHAALARWCQQKGLTAQARLHDTFAYQLNPRDVALQKRLGLQRFRGALLTRAQIDIVLAQEKQQAEALKSWKSRLTELKRQLTSKDAAVRAQGAGAVAAITDPTVLPALESILMPAGPDAALAAVRLIGAFDTPAATEALARQAVWTPYPEVRKEIAAQFKQRPIHGWVPLLLSAMQVPVEVRVQLMGSGDSPAFILSLFRDGPFAQEHMSYTDSIAPVFASDMRGDPNAARNDPLIVRTSPEQTQARAQAQAAQAGRTLAAAESFNRTANLINTRISDTLSAATGREGQADPTDWHHWWVAYNEYSYQSEKPITTTTLATSYNYTSTRLSSQHSCFLAGTLVATWTGPRPIESIRVGDYVLSQDVETGQLAYQPVLGTTHGPPTPMLRLSLADRDVFLTRGHPLWVPGEGWRMPKELKPGALLHTLDGPVALKEVIEWADAETFNLVVAEYSTYFVTDQRLLAHDITFRQPTNAAPPGMAKTAVAAR